PAIALALPVAAITLGGYVHSRTPVSRCVCRYPLPASSGLWFMEQPSPRGPVIISAVLVEGGLAVTAWWLGNWWGYPPGDALALTWSATLWGLAAVLPMLALMLWVERSAWRPWRRLMAVVRRQIAPLFADCSYADLALISALAGLGEE